MMEEKNHSKPRITDTLDPNNLTESEIIDILKRNQTCPSADVFFPRFVASTNIPNHNPCRSAFKRPRHLLTNEKKKRLIGIPFKKRKFEEVPSSQNPSKNGDNLPNDLRKLLNDTNNHYDYQESTESKSAVPVEQLLGSFISFTRDLVTEQEHKDSFLAKCLSLSQAHPRTQSKDATGNTTTLPERSPQYPRMSVIQPTVAKDPTTSKITVAQTRPGPAASSAIKPRTQNSRKTKLPNVTRVNTEQQTNGSEVKATNNTINTNAEPRSSVEPMQHSMDDVSSSDHADNSATNKRKRKRRLAHEIERNFHCKYPRCSKAYGSQGALDQHIRKKHPENPRRCYITFPGAKINMAYPNSIGKMPVTIAPGVMIAPGFVPGLQPNTSSSVATEMKTNNLTTTHYPAYTTLASAAAKDTIRRNQARLPNTNLPDAQVVSSTDSSVNGTSPNKTPGNGTTGNIHNTSIRSPTTTSSGNNNSNNNGNTITNGGSDKDWLEEHTNMISVSPLLSSLQSGTDLQTSVPSSSSVENSVTNKLDNAYGRSSAWSSTIDMIQLSIGEWTIANTQISAHIDFVKQVFTWELFDTSQSCKRRVQMHFADICSFDIHTPPATSATQTTTVMQIRCTVPPTCHVLRKIPGDAATEQWTETPDFTNGMISADATHAAVFSHDVLMKRHGGFPSHYEKIKGASEHLNNLLERQQQPT